MKIRIAIVLLLLAGVGSKVKAEDTVGSTLIQVMTVGRAPITYNAPLISTQAAVEDAERKIKTILCTEDTIHTIRCPVSPRQFETIAENIIRIIQVFRNQNELSLLLPESGKNGAIIGALAASIVLVILEVWEMMYRAVRSPEDGQRMRGTKLPRYNSESAVGVMSRLPNNRYTTDCLATCSQCLKAHSPLPSEFTIFLVRRLLVIMAKVGVAALFGAGVGAIAGPVLDLSRSSKIVTVLLETT